MRPSHHPLPERTRLIFLRRRFNVLTVYRMLLALILGERSLSRRVLKGVRGVMDHWQNQKAAKSRSAARRPNVLGGIAQNFCLHSTTTEEGKTAWRVRSHVLLLPSLKTDVRSSRKDGPRFQTVAPTDTFLRGGSNKTKSLWLTFSNYIILLEHRLIENEGIFCFIVINYEACSSSDDSTKKEEEHLFSTSAYYLKISDQERAFCRQGLHFWGAHMLSIFIYN